MTKEEKIISLDAQEWGVVDGSKAYVVVKKLLGEKYELKKENIQLKNNIINALHRIQLLQMDGEVTVRDLGLIVRDLRGDESV